ncbi:hypothetical protein BJ684DRAFT_16760 [Piptocephalis cylindrospora]|uniref:Uncharacterized protein n=1 Tax=Piptocephalis cylindrospora TaxID=1907219 RepID=A0A4P9Y1U9_9FUNG|nr:hypothetical protein BJ684DRAFT_16760 [Piptocephalis cylindrospora]|eukprot:RKP12787.1 hypothetical protein BJ684DRAFT_16760 [Piptocephalis cylindrospora]
MALLRVSIILYIYLLIILATNTYGTSQADDLSKVIQQLSTLIRPLKKHPKELNNVHVSAETGPFHSLRTCLVLVENILPEVPLYLQWRDSNLDIGGFSLSERYITLFHYAQQCIRHLLSSSTDSSRCSSLASLLIIQPMDSSPITRYPSLDDFSPSVTMSSNYHSHPYTVRAILLSVMYSWWRHQNLPQSFKHYIPGFYSSPELQNKEILSRYVDELQKARDEWIRKILHNDLQSTQPTESLAPYMILRVIDDSLRLLLKDSFSLASFHVYTDIVTGKEQVLKSASLEQDPLSQGMHTLFSIYNKHIYQPEMFFDIPIAPTSRFQRLLAILVKASRAEGNAFSDILHLPSRRRSPSFKHPFNFLISSFPHVLRFLLSSFGRANRDVKGMVGEEWAYVGGYLNDLLSTISLSGVGGKASLGPLISALQLCIRLLGYIFTLSLGNIPVEGVRKLKAPMNNLIRALSGKLSAPYNPNSLHAGYILLGQPMTTKGGLYRDMGDLLVLASGLNHIVTHMDLSGLYIIKSHPKEAILAGRSCDALMSLSSFAKIQMVDAGMKDTRLWSMTKWCPKGMAHREWF